MSTVIKKTAEEEEFDRLVEDAEQHEELAEEGYDYQEPPEDDEVEESSKKRNIDDEVKNDESNKVIKINHGSLMDKLKKPIEQTSVNNSYQTSNTVYQANTSIKQSNSIVIPSHTSPSHSQSLERKCKCQIPAVSRTVAKDGANKGKIFFVCSDGKCRYFEWADDNTTNITKQSNSVIPAVIQSRTSPSHSQSLERKCKCQIPAVSRTVVKDGANKGKQFFACSKGMSDKCSFFEWADDKTASGNTNMNNNSSNSNYQSYNNSNNNNYNNNNNKSSGNSSYSNSSTITCFKCKQTGHWANKCTNR